MENENYDVIIVGGGISGLIAGAALSKEGLRVLLLEKMDKIGGRMRFTRHGDYNVPVAPIANLPDNLDKAMERCDVQAPHYPTGGPNFFNLKKHRSYGVTGVSEEMIVAAYTEGLGLSEEDLKAMHQAYESTRDPETYRGKSFSQWLDGLRLSPRMSKIMTKLMRIHLDHAIKDPDLVAMDTYASTLIRFFISQTPLYTHDQSMPDAFANAILKKKGEIRVLTEVKSILVDQGSATGVLARNMDDSWIPYRASKVIVNVPIFQALDWGLIKEGDFPTDWVKVGREVKPYAGWYALSWYGLKERIIEHKDWVYVVDEEPETMTYLNFLGALGAVSNLLPDLCPPTKQLVYCASHQDPTMVKNKNVDMWPQKLSDTHRVMEIYFREMDYPPLEEIVEFRKDSYLMPTWDLHVFSTYWNKLPDHRAPNIDGLYFTGGMLKPVLGTFGINNAAALGLQCADVVLADS